MAPVVWDADAENEEGEDDLDDAAKAAASSSAKRKCGSKLDSGHLIGG